MPPAIPPKASEPIRKKVSESSEVKKLQLMAKEIEKVNREPEECEPAPPTEPAPKTIKKTTKVKKPPIEGEKNKKTSSAVLDKVPKKTAQRTKGSIALEKVDQDSLTKKKLPNSVDQITKPETGEDHSITDVSHQIIPLKPKASDKPVRVRSTRKVKTVKVDGKEGGRKTPEKKQKQPWSSPLSEEGRKPMDEKTLSNDEDMAVTDVLQDPSKEISQPATTCSFFEKIQQGVKAYFSVRGNLKSDLSVEDKNKKVTEGGINIGSQTKPGVAKEVKEDIKKKTLKFDRKKFESFDRHWSNSESSQPNDFPKTFKPKISRHFRKLKRKKLYHPKKHYVRIQIPRKGYFYRSTIQFKESSPHSVQPPSQPCLQRLASNVVSKSKPKVQVSGMASPSTKSSNIFKKRVKSKEENESIPRKSETGSIEQFIQYLPKFGSLLPEYFEKFTNPRVVTNELQKNDCMFWVDEYNFRKNDGVSLDFGSQNQSSEDGLRKKNKKKNSKRKKNNISQQSISSSENELSDSTMYCPIKEEEASWNHFIQTSFLENSEKALQSEANFETFIKCLNSALGREDFYQLRVSTVETRGETEEISITPKEDSNNIVSNIMDLISETCKEIDDYEAVQNSKVSNIPAIPSRGDSDDSKIQIKSYDSIIQIKSDDSKTQIKSDDSKHRINSSLLEDIDLHLELENYLKTIKSSDTRKATKNTLQPYRWNQIQSHEELEENRVVTANNKGQVEGDQEEGNQKDADVETKKSNTSFLSALSKNDGYCIENQDVIRETKIIASQKNTEGKSIQSDIGTRNVQAKNTLEKASFQFTQMEEAGLLTNSFFHLGRLHTLKTISRDKLEVYEKIKPLITPSSTSFKKKIRNKRKGLILTQNIYCRLAADFPKPRIRIFPSSFSLGYHRYSDETDSFTSTTSLSTFCSDLLLVSDTSTTDNKKNLSPNLQDLIDIYNTVLKENHKADQTGRSSIQRSISGPLHAILNARLNEKMFSSFKNSLTARAEESKDGEKNEPLELKAYVSMFQEILMSSLSIKQIAKMNKMLENLQKYSVENYETMKNLSKKKDMTSIKKDVTVLPVNNTQMKKSVSFKEKKVILQRTENCISDTKLLKPIIYPQKKVKKREAVKVEKREQFSELDSILQTQKKTDKRIVLKTNIKQDTQSKKLKVTVEQNGSNIVSEACQIENENSLNALKAILSDCSETSDLIIENITKPIKSTQLKKSLEKKKTLIKVSHPEGTLKRTNLKPLNQESKPKKAQTNVHNKRIIESGNYKKPTISSTFKRNQIKTVPAPRCSRVKSERNSKMRARYEYNQEQLKSQHPIEAIIESSESKLDERVEKVPLKHQDLGNKAQEIELKNMAFDLNFWRKALAGVLRDQVSSKDLICEFNPTLWSDGETVKGIDRTKSQLLPRNQIKETPDCVLPNERQIKQSEIGKSMDDATLFKHTQNTTRKKLRKVLNTQNTYLCYPSLNTLCENHLVPNKKQSNFYKKLVSCVGSCARSKEVEVSQKMTITEQDIPEKPIELHQKLSTNTILFLNTEITPECCSVEFLFNDNPVGNHSLNLSPKSSSYEVREKSTPEANIEQIEAELPVEQDKSQAKSIHVENHHESPIVIHPAKSQDDDTSFPSLTIQSDSYLKSCSSMAISRNKVEAVFRSNSDMKFYPGRLTENSEENTFVTFVLTPKQKAEANLPSQQIKVVGRPSADPERQTANEDVETQIPLESIVQFIEILSRNRQKETPSKKSKPGYRFGENTPSKVVQRKKNYILSEQTQGSYRECQKKMKVEKLNKAKSEIKREDKKPNEKLKKNIVVSDLTASGHSMEDGTIFSNDANCKTEFKKRENLQTEGDKLVGSSLVDSITECSHKADLRTVRKKIKAPPTFKGKQEIIDTIEVYSKRLLNKKESSQSFKIEETSGKDQIEKTRKKSSQEEKKVRTFKIRIHCNNHTKKSGFKADPVEQSKRHLSIEKKSKDPQTLESSDTKDAIELLESLVSDQGDNGDHLNQTPSIYFDAEGDATDSGHPKSEKEHSQRNTKPSVCFKINISTEKTAKGNSTNVKQEMTGAKSENQTSLSLTPSDVHLLSKTSLNENSKEKIFSKIIKYLQSDNVYYSILLLEAFLKKAEALEKTNATISAKLQEVLKSVETKSKNLMMKKEKNGWLKILSFLEEISTAFEIETKKGSPMDSNDSSDSLDYLKKQIIETKKFIEKIKTLNDKQHVDFQRVSGDPSQSSSVENLQTTELYSCDMDGLSKSETDSTNVFYKIRNSISGLKNRLMSSWSQRISRQSSGDLEEEYTTDEDDFSCPVHSTTNATDIFEFCKLSNGKSLSSLSSLKTKIREQRLCLQFLLNNSYETVSPEIQELKNKVTEKLKFLEQTVTLLDKINEKGCEEKSEIQLNQDRSFFDIASSYKHFLKRSNVETLAERN